MTTLGLRLAQGAAPDLVESTLWHHPEKRRSTHYCTAMYHINRVQSLAVFSGVLCVWGEFGDGKLTGTVPNFNLSTGLQELKLLCGGTTCFVRMPLQLQRPAPAERAVKAFLFVLRFHVSCLNRLFCDDPWEFTQIPRSWKEVFLDSQNTLPTLVRQNDTQTNNLLQPQTVSRSITYTHRHASHNDFHLVDMDLSSTTSGPAISMNKILPPPPKKVVKPLLAGLHTLQQGLQEQQPNIDIFELPALRNKHPCSPIRPSHFLENLKWSKV